MKTLTMRGGRRAGFGIIFTMVFILVAGIITGALLSAAVGHRRLAGRVLNREKALYVAEAGLEQVAQHIANGFGYLPTDPYTISGTIDGSTWRAKASLIGTFRYKVDSTGVVNGVQWCVHAERVELPSWSQYALWMDKNGVIYFVGGEEFNGWVHSNDKLWFSQAGGIGPYFYDKLTSATNEYGGTTNGSYFAKGFQLNADRSRMVDVDFTQLLTFAQSYGTTLTGTTYITFNDSTARITNARRGWTNYNLIVGTNSIIYVRNAPTANNSSTGNVYIGGTIKGRMTIAAERDFLITNHVRYALDPRTNTASSDALGLVAKDDIRITTNAPRNLSINAAILATGQASVSDDGQFMVDNYNSGSPKGDLNVLGSIVQQVRGAVGTFNSSGTATGYSKNYTYDTRFRSAAPPYYPRVATKVNFSGWWEGSE